MSLPHRTLTNVAGSQPVHRLAGPTTHRSSLDSRKSANRRRILPRPGARRSINSTAFVDVHTWPDRVGSSLVVKRFRGQTVRLVFPTQRGNDPALIELPSTSDSTGRSFRDHFNASFANSGPHVHFQ